MRRSSFGIACLFALLLLALPDLASAQGRFGPLGPVCSWPAVGMTAYAGYFGQRKGADISFTAEDKIGTGALKQLRQEFDLQGICTEVAIPVKGNGPLGFAVGCGLSTCFPRPSQETVQTQGGPSYSRSWAAEPQSGNVYAALTACLNPSLLGLAGIRYENFQTNFVNASSPFPNQGAVAEPSAALSFSACFPYMGLVYSSPPSDRGPHIQFGATGFPMLLGSVDYRETGSVAIGNSGGAGYDVPGFAGSNTFSKGYFVDLFGDISIGPISCLQLGAFVKFDAMNATCNVNMGDKIIVGTAPNQFRPPNCNYKFEFQSRIWSIGGRLSVSF